MRTQPISFETQEDDNVPRKCTNWLQHFVTYSVYPPRDFSLPPIRLFFLYILHISARGIWGNHAKLCDLGHTNNARTSLDLNVANFDYIKAKGQLRARHPRRELAATSEPCCKHSGGNVRHEMIRWIYAAIRLRDSGRRLNNQVIMLPLSTLTKVQGGHAGQWG